MTMRTLGILALVASLAAADRIDNVFRICDIFEHRLHIILSTENDPADFL